jgi:hypothetical protein
LSISKKKSSVVRWNIIMTLHANSQCSTQRSHWTLKRRRASVVDAGPADRRAAEATGPDGAACHDEPLPLRLRTLRSLTMRTASTGDLRSAMAEDMPMVSYKAEGPGGRKTDGFLYKYRKGEEVRIVCVCHGSFLTPAEFVEHAGGGEVPNPLRHIVVNPQQSVFL